MNDRPRQNPAYRLTLYAPRQGGFLPALLVQSDARLDPFGFKIIFLTFFDITLQVKPCIYS